MKQSRNWLHILLLYLNCNKIKKLSFDSSLSLEHFFYWNNKLSEKKFTKKVGEKVRKNIKKKVGKNNREKVKKKVRKKWECRKRVKAINNSLTYGPCMLVLSLWYLTNWKYSRNLVAYSYPLPIILEIGKKDRMPEKLQEKIESVIQWHIMGYVAKKCDFATQVQTFCW